MDAIEKAIRAAFEKGDAEDRAFREKVYRSAFAALDRALLANPGVTVEAAIKRRKAMQAKIAEIESEFLPAVAAAAPVTEAPELPAALEPEPETSPPMPTLDDERAQAADDAPASEVPDIVPERPSPGLSAAEAAEVEPDRDERRLRRRRASPVAVILGIAVLAVLGAGLWWAARTGLPELMRKAGQPAAQAPSPDAEGEDYTPDSEAAAPRRADETDEDRDWIAVFSPADPTLVSAPSDAQAQVVQDDGGAFLRIRSGRSGSAISFDVGQGILDRLAGRHAVFDIVARAEDGKDTQMSVSCNFGELGDCGRKRYAVGHERNEYLFDVAFPDKQPGAAGTIAINSDFEGQGRAVDIYAIRVSVAE